MNLGEIGRGRFIGVTAENADDDIRGRHLPRFIKQTVAHLGRARSRSAVLRYRRDVNQHSAPGRDQAISRAIIPSPRPRAVTTSSLSPPSATRAHRVWCRGQCRRSRDRDRAYSPTT
jgi:hypothetical protein